MSQDSMDTEPRERDLAAVGALIGEPARAAMLGALAAGHSLPAGELARMAGVHPATATAHLRRLVDGGLVKVRAQGRHRYHELAGPDIAEALEALSRDRLLAARAIREVDDRDHELTRDGVRLLAALEVDAEPLLASRRVFARACLDGTERRPHLAGVLPAALTSRFVELGWLSRGRGRVLRVAGDYDERLDRWLASA